LGTTIPKKTRLKFDTQVKLAIYHHFAETGRRPSPGDIARMHTTDCALSGYSSSNLMGLRSAWHRPSQVSPPSIASKLPAPGTTPTVPGIRWVSPLPSSLQAQFIHAASNPAILYSCMLRLMDPSPQSGISTALCLPLNGGRISSSPEIICSSSGRKNR
jgi:hypothetical protein